jgi:hypothetical protein
LSSVLPELRCAMARVLPRPFTMPWGSGTVVEEVSGTTEWHEPVIQLLRYEDGSEAVRFCSYNHRGGFQRSPLIVSAADLSTFRDAIADSPRLLELLRSMLPT